MSADERIADIRERRLRDNRLNMVAWDGDIEWLLRRLEAAERVVEAARGHMDGDTKRELASALAAYDAESK